MAEAPIGTLNILVDGDSSGLQREMKTAAATVAGATDTMVRDTEQLSKTLQEAGMTMGQVRFAAQKIKDQIDPMAPAIRRYEAELGRANVALKAGVLTHHEYAQAVEMAEQGLDNFRARQQLGTKTNGAASAGMQQLSYQLSDVATMFSLGARPMQIFASQGGQVVQAIGLMSSGSKGLIGFLGGPWGAVITAATVVMVPLVSKLFEAEDATKKVEFASYALSDAQSILGGVVDLTTGKINTQSDALRALARAQAAAGRVQAMARADQARRAVSDMQNPQWVIDGGMMGPNISRERPIQGQISSQVLNGAITSEDAIKRLEALNKSGRITRDTFLEAAKAVSDLGVESANIKVYEDLEKALDGDTHAMQQFLRANKEHKQGLSDTEKAYKKAFDGAQDFIAGLEQEIAKIGLNAKELRQLELARAKDAAATDAQRKRITELGAEREKAIAQEEKLQQILAAKKETAALSEQAAAMEREVKLVGLSGIARERRLIAMEREVELTPKLIAMAQAEMAGNVALTQELQKQVAAINAKFDARSVIAEQNEDLRKSADAAAHLNDQFRDMISLLNRIGGAGGVLGSLMAVMSGNFNSIASGPVGDVLAYALNTQTGWMKNDRGEDIPRLLGDELRDVFGANGIFGQTLLQTLGNAGLGYAAASAVFGKQSGAGAVGSSIGGIAGGVLGGALQGTLTAAATSAFGSTIGAALGSAVPVVGTILGGLAGSLIGGLFGGSKKGVVGIGGSGSDLSVYGTKHSSGDQVAAATDAANSVIGSLQQLATALGGTVNAGRASVTVGMKNDSWRVDTQGLGRTDLKAGVLDFGKDQAAAVKAVMQDLLKDGVIDGIRASTMRLLQTGGDLDAALQKALAFEGVFKELKATSSPFADELRALSDQFAQLTGIFQQAGASAEEYAQLQELIAIKQRALIDQASASYRSNFYSDAQNVAYAKQTISSTLSPFGYGNVQSVTAYTRLVEATDALANPELYGALMDLADEFKVIKDAAEATKQAQAAAAAQKQAQKEQALADARNAVAQAYSRESGALEQTVDRLARLSETLHDLRDSIYDTDASTVSLATQLARLRKVGGMAAMGDESAAGQLGGVVRDYLSAAKATSATLADFQFAQATAARYVDSAIGAAEAGKTVAQQQLDTLRTQAVSLGVIEDHVTTMAEAVQELNRLLGGGGGSGGGSSRSAAAQAQAQAQVDRLARRIEQTQRMLDSSKSDLAIARLTEKLEKLEAAMVAATLAQKKSSTVLDDADRGGSIAVRIIADDTVTP